MFSDLFKQIKKYETVILFGHINPDGDCYGAQMALKESLSLKFPDKKIFAVGSGLPRFFSLLGEMDNISDEVIKSSLAVILDGNDEKRMEDVRCANAKAFIKIDHHMVTSEFTKGPSVVIEDATSTCEIVFKFIIECQLPINSKVANALYLGILTDTGRFTYVNNFNEIFEIVRDICTHDPKPQEIYKRLNLVSENELYFKAYILNNFKKTNKGILYAIVKNKTLKKFKMNFGKAGSYVNLLSNVSDYGIWFMAVETENGQYHFEVRSSGANIQQVCVKYSGGGHMCAAGFTVDKINKKFINQVINDLASVSAGQKEEK